MSDKRKDLVVSILIPGFIAVIALLCFFMPKDEYSESERRELADFPEITLESVLGGRFMSEFEDYAVDNFPFRDSFRSIKALASTYIFGKKDNNDIYLADGYLAAIEYPLDEDSVSGAAVKFTSVYEKLLKDKAENIYLSIIPDKGYFLAPESGRPSLDYGRMVELMRSGMEFAQYIDIFPYLELEDYYKTDTHWRQEKIIDAASALSTAMSGGEILEDGFTVNKLNKEFFGVYYGQAALPMKGEELYWLSNNVTDGAEVYDHQNGKSIGMYDMEKGHGKDPYELFLSGPLSLVTIKNPSAENDRRLVIFRDSFGSAIAPLLTEQYSEIVLIDIRYILSATLANLVDFEDCDVLFLYSSLVLNNSETIK